MSADLLLIIVGSILFLIAVGDSIKASNSAALIHTNLRIPMGIFGVLLVIFGGFSYGATNQLGQIEQPVVGNKSVIEGPINKVEVISPLEGDSVKCRILTMGVYPDAHEMDIWVLLKPSNEKYYRNLIIPILHSREKVNGRSLHVLAETRVKLMISLSMKRMLKHRSFLVKSSRIGKR